MKTLHIKNKDFKALCERDEGNQFWMVISGVCVVVFLIISFFVCSTSRGVYNVEIIQLLFGFFVGVLFISYLNYKVIFPITERTKKLIKKQKTQETDLVKKDEEQ